MTQLTIQQAFGLALQNHQAGRLSEAEQIYRQILAQQPKHVDAMHNLGSIAHQVGRDDIAVELIRQAINLNPNLSQAYYNLGDALKCNGQLDEAIAAYRTAIDLRPNLPEARINLGVALKEKGDLDGAIAAYRQGIAFRPHLAEAHNNLGNALRDKGKVDEAIIAYRQAISLRPDYAQAHSNLGNNLLDKGELDQAVLAYRQAIAIRPNYAEALYNLGNAQKERGQLDDAIAAYRRAIALKPNLREAHSNLVYAMHFHAGYTSKAIAEEHRRWNHQHAEPLAKFIRAHSNDRSPDRRLRIGYVSPDFREHVVGRNLLPLLWRHDHRQFEVTCYAQVQRPDDVTSEFQRFADSRREIIGLSDEQLAARIREDGIDILVDLTLHTADNRLLVFARKPAPVQATYLGYCSGTGMTAIDYRFSDPHLDPPETDLSQYAEKTVRLPRTFWCYQPRPSPDPSPMPALGSGFVTFGCLNQFAKVSPAAQGLWASILSAVPDSRLMIHALPGAHRNDVLQRMELAGVANHRVIFVGQQSWMDYAQTYSQIDIALDPFPYGGGITTCDALWMGVPVVTLSGEMAVGRGGRSILSNLGLSELIAYTPEQYWQIAVDLAQNRDRIDSLRRGMRARMQASPLMDSQAFARDVENAYRQMWQAWCGQAKTRETKS